MYMHRKIIIRKNYFIQHGNKTSVKTEFGASGLILNLLQSSHYLTQILKWFDINESKLVYHKFSQILMFLQVTWRAGKDTGSDPGGCG